MSEHKEYMRLYMKTYSDQRRLRLIDQLGGKCVRCGSTEKLEFDHIDPATKSFGIRSSVARSETAIQEELKKCQLLCKSCHDEKSISERSVEHGSGKAGKRGCPCRPCKDRRNEYMKEWKRNRKASGSIV